MKNKYLEKILNDLMYDIEFMGNESDDEGMEILQNDLEKALKIVERIRNDI